MKLAAGRGRGALLGALLWALVPACGGETDRGAAPPGPNAPSAAGHGGTEASPPEDPRGTADPAEPVVPADPPDPAEAVDPVEPPPLRAVSEEAAIEALRALAPGSLVDSLDPACVRHASFGLVLFGGGNPRGDCRFAGARVGERFVRGRAEAARTYVEAADWEGADAPKRETIAKTVATAVLSYGMVTRRASAEALADGGVRVQFERRDRSPAYDGVRPGGRGRASRGRPPPYDTATLTLDGAGSFGAVDTSPAGRPAPSLEF